MIKVVIKDENGKFFSELEFKSEEHFAEWMLAKGPFPEGYTIESEDISKERSDKEALEKAYWEQESQKIRNQRTAAKQFDGKQMSLQEMQDAIQALIKLVTR